MLKKKKSDRKQQKKNETMAVAAEKRSTQWVSMYWEEDMVGAIYNFDTILIKLRIVSRD